MTSRADRRSRTAWRPRVRCGVAAIGAVLATLPFTATLDAQSSRPAARTTRSSRLARDASPARQLGVIEGVVTTTGSTPTPLRRATVTVSGAGLPEPVQTVTSNAGTFRLDGLPLGRYVLSASKPGWVPMYYGALRAGRPGTAITVSAGAPVRATLRLPHGAAITGVVSDGNGAPRQGIEVAALALTFDPTTGRRRAVAAGLTTLTTDDLGVYRIFGLPAGDYLVYARPDPRDEAGGARLLSSDDVQRALADVQVATSLARPTPGIAPAPSLPAAVADTSPRVGLAGVYYPGAVSVDNAIPVSVREGEERTGISFDLDYLPKVTVTGTVELVPNRPAPVVRLTPASQDGAIVIDDLANVRVDADGRFTVEGVPPGRYLVTARSAQRHDGSPDEAWAPVEIAINGTDASLEVRLQAPLTISGRLVFHGARPPHTLPAAVAIPLLATSGRSVDAVPVMRLEPGGRFTVPNLPQGPLRRLGVAGIRSPIGGWYVASVMSGTHNLLDEPPRLSSDLTDVVVTLTDRAPVLSGIVHTSGATAGEGQTVIVFPADRRAWFFGSWRIAGVRTGPDGRYSISNLPPGDYLAAVSDDVEADEWFDSALLQRLTNGATAVTLDTTSRTLDLNGPSAARR